MPLMVRIPGVAQDGRGGGRVVDAYAQAVDVMPTVLELCGVPDPGTPHGRSLLPLLRGERAAPRAVSVSTIALAGSARPAAAAPARATTLIQRPGWALLYGVDAEPQLFDTAADPVQEHNVLGEHRQEARELHAAFAEFLRDVGAPATVREPVESDARLRR